MSDPACMFCGDGNSHEHTDWSEWPDVASLQAERRRTLDAHRIHAPKDDADDTDVHKRSKAACCLYIEIANREIQRLQTEIATKHKVSRSRLRRLPPPPKTPQERVSLARLLQSAGITRIGGVPLAGATRAP